MRSDSDDIDARTERALQTRIRKKRIQILQDRLQKLEERRQEMLLEEEIAMAEADLYGEDEEEDTSSGDLLNPDALLSQLLSRVLSQQAPPAAAQQQSGGAPPAAGGGKLSLSEDQLRAFIERVPKKKRAQLAKMDDQDIIDELTLNLPDFIHQYDDNTVSRTVKILKEVS